MTLAHMCAWRNSFWSGPVVHLQIAGTYGRLAQLFFQLVRHPAAYGRMALPFFVGPVVRLLNPGAYGCMAYMCTSACFQGSQHCLKGAGGTDGWGSCTPRECFCRCLGPRGDIPYRNGGWGFLWTSLFLCFLLLRSSCVPCHGPPLMSEGD